MLLRMLRPFVERVPFLARTYRTIKDEWSFHRQRVYPTQLGFGLMGNNEMHSGDFEPQETVLLQELLRNADVFIDIGANIGFYTCLARSLNKQVLAFEPLQENLRYLYANLQGNLWNDVEVYPLGLADKPGLATLFGASTGASLVDGWAEASPLLRRTIPLSTLDIMVGSRFENKRVLIKIDVEGAEYGLLQGAEKILAMRPAPVWMVEICLTENQPTGLNDRFIETFELFWKHGYTVRLASHDRSSVSRNDVEGWLSRKATDHGTYNYLFIKDQS